MIRVTAPSRLHFGLFNLGAHNEWRNLDEQPIGTRRRFGGVGLMIAEPGWQIAIQPAHAWAASGPAAERVLEFARTFAATLSQGEWAPRQLTIEKAVPEHVGLGTGTQLGLSVAKALAIAAGHADWDASELARRVSRGERSAVGVHGFDRGGFLVEVGKHGDELSPLLLREEFPPEWRIILILPDPPSGGVHGAAERQMFEKLLLESTPNQTDSLCRLVLLGMLPALRERNCDEFGEALYDFNARVGEMFAPAQGARYASQLVSGIVSEVRRLGLPGVGQSSWGPAVFAVAENANRAAKVAARLRDHFGAAVTIQVTAAFGGPAVAT
jgi:beta-RFAP synthase